MGTQRPLKLRRILKSAVLLRESGSFASRITLTCGANINSKIRAACRLPVLVFPVIFPVSIIS